MSKLSGWDSSSNEEPERGTFSQVKQGLFLSICFVVLAFAGEELVENKADRVWFCDMGLQPK